MSKKREERKKKRLQEEKSEKYKKFSRVFYLDKEVGETPLQLLEHFQQTEKFKKWQAEAKEICAKRKVKRKGCEKIPLAYAGRLDPMAEGKMLMLAGEACKERKKYLGLDKEYVFEVLLGFESDSSDILGIVHSDNDTVILQNNNMNTFKKKVTDILKNMKGKRVMQYPVFSSKAVNGKPLFLWALEERLGEIQIPSKKVEIYDITLQQVYFIQKEQIWKTVSEKIFQVKKVTEESKKLGEDFRREKVLKSWENSLGEFSPEKEFIVLQIKTTVSSGTYMRTLAKEIGESLKTIGLAYSIKRTKIGKVHTFLGLKFFKKM